MPIFEDGELGSSVRSKINAAITTVDELEAQGGNKVAVYPDRATFVAAIDGGLSVVPGTVASDGTVLYVASAGATAIADMPGWLPFGTVESLHFGGNDNPGTTDMGAAIVAALSYGRKVLIRGTQATSVPIRFNNKRLEGRDPHGDKIVGLSASLAATDPIVSPGRSAHLLNLGIEYDSLTGSETQDERIGVHVGDDTGGIFQLQRAGRLDNLIVKNCGTCIGDAGNGMFSAEIGAIEIGSHSYAGIDIRRSGGTGNVWGSIYINGGDTYTPTYGFNSEQGMLGSIGLLNIEHNAYSGASFRLKDTVSGWIGKLHLEGVDVSADGGTYVELDAASPRIESFGAINTRMSFDNVSVVRLVNTGFWLPGTNGQETTYSRLSVGTYHTVGLSDPNATLYPSYPSGRRGLEKIAGFQHFKRDVSLTDDLYEVSVDSHQWGAYPARTLSIPFYKYADSRHSNPNGNIRFLRYDGRGIVDEPVRNSVENGAFDTWVSTSGTNITTATETATGWFVNGSSAGVDFSQEAEDFGADNSYFMRFSNNTAGAGTFQLLYHDITEIRPLIDAELVLSFEMRGGSAGRVLEQIFATLFTGGGGSPASVYNQVISGANSNLDATTDWQFYEFTFSGVDSASITTLGTSPYVRLAFQINDAAATRAAQIDLRNVKLERGNRATRFVRHRND
jgi:hypothetical protein